jgi:hypothetical protein
MARVSGIVCDSLGRLMEAESISIQFRRVDVLWRGYSENFRRFIPIGVGNLEFPTKPIPLVRKFMCPTWFGTMSWPSWQEEVWSLVWPLGFDFVRKLQLTLLPLDHRCHSGHDVLISGFCGSCGEIADGFNWDSGQHYFYRYTQSKSGSGSLSSLHTCTCKHSREEISANVLYVKSLNVWWYHMS